MATFGATATWLYSRAEGSDRGCEQVALATLLMNKLNKTESGIFISCVICLLPKDPDHFYL